MRYQIPNEPNSCPKCGCKDRQTQDLFRTAAPVRNRHTRRQTWACEHRSFQTWMQEYGEAVMPTDKELVEMARVHK